MGKLYFRSYKITISRHHVASVLKEGGVGAYPKNLAKQQTKKIHKNSRIPKSCKFDEFMSKILRII